jgi:hypothetical protein
VLCQYTGSGVSYAYQMQISRHSLPRIAPFEAVVPSVIYSHDIYRADRCRGTRIVARILTEHFPRGERLIDVLIDIAKSEYPDDWSHYCDLAQNLAPETDKQGPNISTEDCARRRLTGKDPNAYGLIADFYSSFLGGAPSQLQQMTWEASRLAQKFRDRLVSVSPCAQQPRLGERSL